MPAAFTRTRPQHRYVERASLRAARDRLAAEMFVPATPARARRADRAAGQFVSPAYVDYGRRLTAEGGIAMVYKDIDSRFVVLLGRVLFWLVATGGEAWLLYRHPPFANSFADISCVLVAAAINWLIVRKPPEVARTIEIRPDCMVLEGRYVFWLRYMDAGWPSFQPADETGNLILTGIYGTRQVEFLTARHFDPLDRSPEVLSAHLQDAMKQLWTQPY